jgi:hypothetical protein
MLAGWIHRRQQEAIAYLEAGGEPSPSGAAGTGAHAVHGCTEFPVGKSRSRYRPQAAPADHDDRDPGYAASLAPGTGGAQRRQHEARSPDGAWTSQIARNLTDFEDGFFKGSRLLIHDRDPKRELATRVGSIVCRRRLGGVVDYDERAA